MRIQEAFDVIKDDIKKTEELFKANIASDVYLITKVGEYILDSGGKRLRPLVLLLSGRLCGYSGERHIPLAAAVEFIHTATLLHDDVVDNANLRRGNASANSIWGNGSSVLVGDYLLSRAFALAVKDGDAEVLRVLAETTTRMAEGEVLQLMKHSDIKTTEGEYLDVITNKTAVLFSSSCRMAAILSDAPPRKEEALANFGMSMGIAYQLVDDCLDYTSRDGELGKRTGNDLKEGKVTLPFIKAYGEALEEERDVMRGAIESDRTTEGQIKGVFGIIKKYRGIEYTTGLAGKLIEEAKGWLEAFPPDTERAALSAVADHVIERTY